MWKKIMVVIVTLTSTLIVGLAFYNVKMDAASPYNIGGNVYGRIGAPVIGDRIFLGTKSNLQQPMGWVLLEDYDFNDSYLAFSTSAMDHTTYYDNAADTHLQYHQFDASKTAIWKRYDQFNARLAANTQDMKLVANRAAQWQNQFMAYARAELNDPVYGISILRTYSEAIQDSNSPVPTADRIKAQNIAVLSVIYESNRYGIEDSGQTLSGKPVAYPYTDILTIDKGDDLFCVDCSISGKTLPAYPLEPIDLKFSVDGTLKEAFAGIYTISNYYRTSEIAKKRGFLGIKGLVGGSVNYVAHTLGTPTAPILENAYDIQAAIEFNKSYLQDHVVFSVSQPSSNGNGSLTVLTPITTKGDYRTGEDMKLRIADAKMQVSFEDIRYQNESIYSKQGIAKTDVAKVEENSTIQLQIVGNAGSDAQGVYTLSALVFDASGKFIRYIPLESTEAGGNVVDLDISTLNLPVGEYTIKTVNESYNQDVTETTPAACSALSSGLKIQIVEPLVISYTASSMTYTYQDNVSLNAVVGNLLLQKGIPPYHVAFDTSGNDDYLNFAFSQNSGITGSSINLKVAANAPDASFNSLNAGSYDICMIGYDVYDEPNSPQLGKSKACITIKVEKAALSVSFDDSQLTKKSISEAQSGWQERATANITNGTKVRYAITSTQGNITTNDIAIDPDNGALSYSGNGAYGKITIQATVDDDSASGNDNYNSAIATKEIVIYQDVDGAVTPDTQSADPHSPVFTASDPNAKTNGRIGALVGMLGTPDNGISGSTTYHYEIKQTGDYTCFEVNSNTGEIKTKVNLGVRDYQITLVVKDAWSEKEIPLTIQIVEADAENLLFYENSTSNTIINTKSVAYTDTGVNVFATVKNSSNPNPVRYQLKNGERTDVISVNMTSGAISILGTGTVVIQATKQGVSGQAQATAELTFTVTAGAQNFIYTDNAGNELPKSGSNYKAYSEVYAPSKTFQLYTSGNSTGTSVTYQLKAGSPTDVISVDSSGLVTILNATLTNQMGKVIVQASSHDPSGNYDDKTIDLPINIEKGTRVISFAENPIYVTNGKGKVTPVTEVDGVTDTDGDVLIEVDSNEDHTIAWTNDNKNIDYNYSGDTGKDIKIHATKPMDRNYKAAEADGTIHIMGPDENILAITSPGQIIYGDHFTIRSSQYDADSTNVDYTFEVDGTTYISNPTVNGNSAEFDALKVSGSNKTTITVTRTADGEVPLSKKVQVTVLPKPIEIMIDDKDKLKGEQNPTLTYQDFRTELVSWNGVQDVIQENDIKLSTTANTNSNAGTYPIKGDANSLNKTYPNYSFTFKEGTLTITEENIEDDWYHLELDDGNNTAYTGDWTNQDVNIVSDHAEYINLSLDQSTWNPNYVTVTKDGESNQSFWMKKDSGAITKEKQVLIKIDKTAPKVKGIKAKDTNNKLQDIINMLSGGIFFKPGTSFEITTDDSNSDLKVSGTKEIAYKVYKIETQARAGEEKIKDGNLTVTNEKASITISETTGTYEVCITPTDNAGNSNTESCHEVDLKKIDVDVDGDGKPDFNDPDGDGCPDLNIKWKDANDESKWIVINGDRDYDGIPDLNIDSDGDGKPDLNIDTDKDGKPDLNLVILKKGDWKPTKCVKQDIDSGILEEFCTGTSVKAVINVDTDNDGIPNINIDTNGDMKADINISKDGETAFINIAVIHDWLPNKNYTSNKFTYDSIGKDEIKPELNIDTDGDGRPDINLDIDGDGVPDLNVDIDGDNIPDMNIDSTGDGQPDINVDSDGDGKPDTNLKEITEWKPEKNIDGDFPYDTMSFDEPDEPTKPDEPQNPDQGNNTDVKGSYYPGDNVGGAITGDNTNRILYTGLIFITLGIILYMAYKRKFDR